MFKPTRPPPDVPSARPRLCVGMVMESSRVHKGFGSRRSVSNNHSFKAVPSGTLTIARHSQGFRGPCKTPGAGMGLAQHLLTQESSCPSLMTVLVIGP